MPRAPFTLALLLVVNLCFTLWLEPVHGRWLEQEGRGESVLAAVLGDSRRLFASHFFEKGDVYFHSGYYPTIFDRKKLHAPKLLAATEAGQTDHAAHAHDKDGRCLSGEGETDILGPPLDWIDAFSRHFYLTQHTHLERGEEREMLPWLRLSAELDPQRVDTYLVAAFWLRTALGRPQEAEAFLRDGLRANPNHPQLLLELGQVYHENFKDADRARLIWQLALRRWHQVEAPKEEADTYLLEKIVARLANLEEIAGHWKEALGYLETLRQVSPMPQVIAARIEEVRAKLAPSTPP